MQTICIASEHGNTTIGDVPLTWDSWKTLSASSDSVQAKNESELKKKMVDAAKEK